MEEIVKGMGQQSVGKLAEANIKIIVKDAFKETGGNIDEPTKETIIKTMDYLRNFSKHYRSMDVIIKHYNEMMQLVHGLNE